ncbi:hypothetical protein ACFLSF_01190 [Candidatus Bipolaricaulota bacterium]
MTARQEERAVRTEKELLQLLVEYLKSEGYSERSLAVEMRVGALPGRAMRLDVALVDPESHLPLALYEVRGTKSPGAKASATHDLREATRLLGMREIPAYVVWPAPVAPFIEFERVLPEGFPEEITIPDAGVPSETQRSIIRGSWISNRKKRQRSWRTALWIVCGVLASGMTTVFILDLLGRVELEASSLVLLAGVAVLLLIPFFDRIKFYGIELERLLKRREK